MLWNLPSSPSCSLLIAVLVSSILFADINVVLTEDCNRPDEEEIFQKSNCTGYEVAVHAVWTELQCLDNCFRHPNCDKYIYYGQGNQNCKLLNTGEISVNLPKITGACAPENITALRDFALGTKGCP